MLATVVLYRTAQALGRPAGTDGRKVHYKKYPCSVADSILGTVQIVVRQK
jgi:hypothetical protein